MRKIWIPAVAAAAALVLAGCGSDSGGSSGAGGSSSSSGSAAGSSAAAAALTTADSSLGTIVVDAQGRTVYYFDKDTPDSGSSTCSGQCLDNWPPVVADAQTPAVDGVTGTVGTITRDDGTLQATLNGLPLYLYAGDKASGDVAGQGVGGVWWVVAPDGTKIGGAAASSSSAGLLPQGPTY